MRSWWRPDEKLLKNRWRVDEGMMKNWWRPDEKLMKSWWKADEKLMKSWWKADEELMKSWWRGDDQKLAFLAIFTKPNHAKPHQTYPNLLVRSFLLHWEKNYHNRTLGSKVIVFGHFHHTKPCQTSPNRSQSPSQVVLMALEKKWS